MICVSRYSLVFQLITGEVHKRTAWCCEPREHSPNSLGREDKHKIGMKHRQMHPSMIGNIDVLESSKDVGQSGMLSPWSDLKMLYSADINKYPNIKWDLFEFIQSEFPDKSITFDCDNIVDYNKILDKLVEFGSNIKFEYKVPTKEELNSRQEDND